jgi:cysteine-rich repeat protein
MLALVGCGDNLEESATCGDGKVDSGEQCDGDANCTADCTWVCSNPATDCPQVECQITTCNADHACAVAPVADRAACSNGLCAAGACVHAAACGNGVLEPGEECDFGSDNGSVAGCDVTCGFSCETLSNTCDDGNPCNGVEICGQVTDNGATGQACLAGSAATDGTSCGSGMICKSATCIAGVCGDGYVSGTEECDDGNAVAGDGCENDCSFSCVSTDSSRNCTVADPCHGQGTCNDTTHVCRAGTPLVDGTSCGGNNYCRSATCTMPVCGNGVVEPGEQCDGGVGCTASCQWECSNASTDCGAAPQCDMFQCSSHQCRAVPDGSQNGMACGAGGMCSNGACNSADQTCGNGVVEGTEQCDFGAGNGPGTGCESSCTFSCQSNTDCSDGNACDGTEMCNSVTVNGNTGKQCAAGTPLATGASCGSGKICLSNQCQLSVCGDGYVDASAGETCELPNVGTCDASCHTIVCGDGMLEGSEQCDDGNTTNLDGCDSSCKFEQVQRITMFKMAFAPSATCPNNAFGSALVGIDLFGQAGARTQITAALDQGILDGSLSINLVAHGLDDLTGTADSSMSFGLVSGLPASSATTYNENALDWWYNTDASTIDASRVPLHALSGSIAGRTATVGPGEVFVAVRYVGITINMDMFDATIRTDIGPSGSLTLSSNGMNPGHLASEHDAPNLTSFLTMGTPPGTCSGSSCRCVTVSYDSSGNAAGTATACPSGELCGSATAASLYTVAIAPSMVGDTCNNFYSTTNTVLDAYISGCKYAGLVNEITATQPDTSRDGHVYTFQTDSMHHVNACKKDGVTQSSLTGCLNNAAFSSLFYFTTGRVIAK